MIEVRNLTKRYGQVYAVNDVSFTVDDGEILGFLGPNGAGKTTTMNIITGYLAATSGDVIINGVDIQAEPEKAKRSIGYLPDTPPLYGDMKVAEYLKFVADIKRVRSSIRSGMIEEIMDMVK
ncbi:MAG: ATP-binding cassette domain-containing protein, partial [Clostridiales bacterium]|nr:ATP-binding cassette domain-containing protein [Clostridiales bacterium]